MELEFHQLEKKHAALRITDAQRTARLVASLCEHGQQQPVLVVRASGSAGEVERYVLIDGYTRVEGRGQAKGNSIEQSSHRAQHRERLSQALDRVRQAARRDPSTSRRATVRQHLRQEPDAVVPHVRICAGGGSQEPSLPRPVRARSLPAVRGERLSRRATTGDHDPEIRDHDARNP
jgi:hypothetical protein